MEAVVGILGMAPCDGTDAVPPNARSHTVLLAGTLIGDAQVLLCRPLCVFLLRPYSPDICPRSFMMAMLSEHCLRLGLPRHLAVSPRSPLLPTVVCCWHTSDVLCTAVQA